MSYAFYVFESRADQESGKGSTNGCRFQTKEEADAYGRNLLSRWTLPVGGESRFSEDQVNYLANDFGDIKSLESARKEAAVSVCPNCGQWQHGGRDCMNECKKRGFVTLICNKKADNHA